MRKFFEEFLDCYLKQRDLEKILSFFTEDVISVGTGAHEVGFGKAELRKLMKAEIAQLPDTMGYEYSDYFEMPVSEQVINIFANVQIMMVHEGENLEMHTRLTCNCVRLGNEWKFTHAHMSVPSGEQEENHFFPLHYGKRAKGVLTTETSSKLLELISEALPGGIVGAYLEEGYPLYTINDRMLEILGYTYEEMIQATNEKMINIIYEEDRKLVEESIPLQFDKAGEYELTYRVVGKNGRLLWMSDIGKKVITVDGRVAMISIMTDITERIKREEALQFAAERDSLTELYNRKKAMLMIKEIFARGEGGCLFIGDVDNFKNINDTRGHFVGDKVLRKLAEIMKAYTGENALACRLGGDEYAMFFYQKMKLEESMKIMERIQEEFLFYVRELVPELSVSFSVGGAVRKENEILDDLYCRADDALYLAKQNKGTMVIL